jgi:N-acetylmuramoyl-L-alanine amidase
MQVQAISTGEPVEAPVRGLRSIDAPAVAIELGSLAPDVDAAPLTKPDLLQQISKAISEACDSFARGGA